MRKKKTKLVIISDTHGYHWEIDSLPKADILIHCGDFTKIGRIEEVTSFDYWLDKQKYKFSNIICIAGNHDIIFQKEPNLARLFLTNYIYLENQEITINGLKIYGSPYQPEFRSWAFNLPRKGNELKENWNKIPNDVDILITHCPPFRILDRENDECLGCELLTERIRNLNNLKLHVFGHIHAAYGTYPIGHPIFINASICDENYKPINKPIIIEL